MSRFDWKPGFPTRGIDATVDVLVAGATTNRLVFYGGILISNIVTGYW